MDRLDDLYGAEGSTALVLRSLHGRGVDFGAVGLYGINLEARTRLEAGGVQFFEPSGSSLWSQASTVVRAVRAVRPDVIHATLARAELVSHVASGITGVPVVSSIVNMQYSDAARAVAPSPRKLELYRQLDGFLARTRTLAFHAISLAAAREAQRALGISDRRIILVPRGRDDAALGRRTPERRAAVRAALGVDSNQPIILNVARQDPQKGQRYLLEAFAQVTDTHDGPLLLIAGREGAASAGLGQQIRKLSLGQSVRMLGHRTDVPDLLAGADVFVFPSLYEGMGGALIEALALEVPIVASNIGPVAETVGDAAILVAPRDVDALAVELRELVRSPDRRAEFAVTGRELFEAKYTNERYIEDMLGFYTTVSEAARTLQQLPRPERRAYSRAELPGALATKAR